MTDAQKIDNLYLALNRELRYYAKEVMGIKKNKRIDAFVDGYFENIRIGDRNTNPQHRIAMLTLHCQELHKVSQDATRNQ